MTDSTYHNMLRLCRFYARKLHKPAVEVGAPEPLRRGVSMGNDNDIPYGNILPFPSGDRKKRGTDGESPAAESLDHGPSPEESLRMMRAFVGIKNQKVRENLIEMLEDASRMREKADRKSVV